MIERSVFFPRRWMLCVLQGGISAERIIQDLGNSVNRDAIDILLHHVLTGALRDRNRAIVALASVKQIPIPIVCGFLMITEKTVRSYIDRFRQFGAKKLFVREHRGVKKHEESDYKNALFGILHSPPKDHGINRTSWRMQDLGRIMGEHGLPICKDGMRRIIKDAGFRFRKAKKVLTSTDPDFREKLEAITNILSSLSCSERFFSIDEFGPVSVRMRGGRALTGPNELRVIPQRQKSKGTLILVGALELSSNQISYFYAEHKRTAEMIKLLYLLLSQYQNMERLYLSWDAASWHVSKKFLSEVEKVNTVGYRTENRTPAVALAPLPACAQFLNVIESVFSGMAKAIIHNSDYQSVEECKTAIDTYVLERNLNLKEHPKRAGNKIWGKEPVLPIFNESNNCKDPRW